MLRCIACKKPSKRPYCQDCGQIKLIERGGTFEESMRDARRMMLPRFYFECPAHGLTFHSARKGDCLLCRMKPPGKRGPRGNPVRVAARMSGARSYPHICATHGETPFDTVHGKCLKCFTTSGARRKSPAYLRPGVTIERVDARREGRPTYLGYCDSHGPVSFSTQRGRCLKCFTTAGHVRRPAKAPRASLPRTVAEARKAGKTRYWATCVEHGPAFHSTGRAGCLKCYARHRNR